MHKSTAVHVKVWTEQLSDTSWSTGCTCGSSFRAGSAASAELRRDRHALEALWTNLAAKVAH